MNAPRVVGAAGACGAILTIVILAMSVLLRLGTQMQEGQAISILPADIEVWARIAHRVAAMGVGILAALALVAAWKGDGSMRRPTAALAAVIGLTLLLAVIGRYTPGYRVDAVTVLNVAGGVALAAAFWALRPRLGAPADGVALAALALLLLLAALGAAADAAALRGERAFGPVHLWIAAIFACLAAWAAWRQRARRAVAIATVLATLAQFGLGLALIASREPRPLGLGWAHAMLACLLALLLVSLGFGRDRQHLA